MHVLSVRHGVYTRTYGCDPTCHGEKCQLADEQTCVRRAANEEMCKRELFETIAALT
jgi:hypothetical protein